MPSNVTYCNGDETELPEEARATFRAATELGQKLAAQLEGMPFDVVANALVNVLIGYAAEGGPDERENVAAVFTHSLEYVKRLDLQAPAGTRVN